MKPIKIYCSQCNTTVEALPGDGKKHCQCGQIYVKNPADSTKYIKLGAKNSVGDIYRVHGYDKKEP